MKKILIIVVLVALTSSNLFSQTFDPLSLFGKGKPIKLNGGINAAFLYNHSSNNTSDISPFNYVVGANLNIYIKGINIPLDFNYSNTQFSYRFQPIPFNRIAIHPKYKIATLHAGSISLSLSPYTLNGAQFNGAGLELAPQKWKFMILGGKFSRGSGDYLMNTDIQPTFARWGHGFGASYQLKNMLIGANVFYAKDDTNSVTNIPKDVAVTPKQNLVSSIVSSGTLSGIKYSFEVANSFITDNLNSKVFQNSSHFLSRFMRTNGSTSSKYATNAKLNYLVPKINLDAGLSYERVDFNYQTLGSLYNINGFENIGVTMNKPFFNGKLNINGQVGVQNDLGDDSIISQKSKRLLTTFNANYNPIQKLSFNISYSNTRGVTNIRNLNNIANQNNLVPQFLDSLRLVQLNQNANFSANYQLEATAEKNSSVNFNYSYQKGDQKEGEFFLDLQGTKFHNASLNYYTVLPKQDAKWNFGLNYSKTSQGADSNNTNALGVNFNFGKKIFKKRVSVTIGSGYNTTRIVANVLGVNIFNFKAAASYIFYKRHVLNFNAIVQKQSRRGLTIPQTSNTTSTMSLTYNYNF